MHVWGWAIGDELGKYTTTNVCEQRSDKDVITRFGTVQGEQEFWRASQSLRKKEMNTWDIRWLRSLWKEDARRYPRNQSCQEYRMWRRSKRIRKETQESLTRMRSHFRCFIHRISFRALSGPSGCENHVVPQFGERLVRGCRSGCEFANN